MESIDKIFYINLDDSHERMEHFLNQCAINNIPSDKIERFPAIDGTKHVFTQHELSLFKKADYLTYLLTPFIISKKIMGNQLSHLNILLEMKKRNYDNIIIFQDDALLKKDFVYYIDKIMEDIPEDSEIINIGLHNKSDCQYFEPYDLTDNNLDTNILDKQKTNFVYLYRTWNKSTCLRVNPASLAYIVTKKGCNNLIDHFYTNGFLHATDWNYNLYLQSKNIFYGSKYVLVTGNNLFKSKVFVDVDDYHMDQLLNINQFYTDKNTTHSYFNLYNELFTPIRKTAKNILEIGIGNFNEKNGGSILLWRLYFKNALIHGADIISRERVYDSVLKNPGIKTYLNVDAYSTDFVDSFKEKNFLFDLIIDDGPHTFESQCQFITLYSELLTDNGILVIEDIQDISFIEKFKELTPDHLKKYIRVYDLRNNKNRYDDIVFVINKNNANNPLNNPLNVFSKNIYIEDINKPLLISYENDLANNINAKMFKKTLDKNGWEYLFIGEGKEWSGFRDKIIGYYEYLNLLPNNKIVILSDSRDVFCLRKPDLFVEKVKDIIDKRIIVSTEMFLVGHMNWSKEQIANAKSNNPDFFWQGEPLDNYWKFYDKENNIPFRKYVNSGLMIGRVQHFINMFNWIIENNFNDDQLGVSQYTNTFPELIYLDYNASILHTSTFGVDGSLYNNEIQKLDTPTLSELIGLSSYFLHIPGINISKGQKYTYDIVYNLFDKDIINTTMFELYGLRPNLNDKNCYFITNDE